VCALLALRAQRAIAHHQKLQPAPADRRKAGHGVNQRERVFFGDQLTGKHDGEVIVFQAQSASESGTAVPTTLILLLERDAIDAEGRFRNPPAIDAMGEIVRS
jgi:hypothetical protein